VNKIANLLGHVLWTADAAPTRQTEAVFEMLSEQLEAQLAQLATVVDDELPRFNEALRRARLDPIDVPTHRPD